MLLFAMPDSQFDLSNQLCLEICYELLLEPWILTAVQEHLSHISSDLQFNNEVLNLLKLTFTRYQLSDV